MIKHIPLVRDLWFVSTESCFYSLCTIPVFLRSNYMSKRNKVTTFPHWGTICHRLTWKQQIWGSLQDQIFKSCLPEPKNYLIARVSSPISSDYDRKTKCNPSISYMKEENRGILRSLTPWTTLVVGSSRFRFFSDSTFAESARLSPTSSEGFRPNRELSRRSRATAGRKRSTGHHRIAALTAHRRSSRRPRSPGFLRFGRTRTRILPVTSSSSETDMEMVFNIEDEDIGVRERERSDTNPFFFSSLRLERGGRSSNALLVPPSSSSLRPHITGLINLSNGVNRPV